MKNKQKTNKNSFIENGISFEYIVENCKTLKDVIKLEKEVLKND